MKEEEEREKQGCGGENDERNGGASEVPSQVGRGKGEMEKQDRSQSIRDCERDMRWAGGEVTGMSGSCTVQQDQ